MNAFSYPVIILVSLVISGCSVPHKCKLGENCYNLIDNYEAAKRKEGNKESVIERDSEGKPINPPTDFKKNSEKSETTENVKIRKMGSFSLTEKPVYTPPVPLRIWLAPWRDKDNILHSSEYIYVLTKGGWNYGELRNGGSLTGSSKLYGPKVTNESLKELVQPQEGAGLPDPENMNNTESQSDMNIPRLQDALVNSTAPGSTVTPNPFVSPFSAPGNIQFSPVSPN